MRFRPRPRPLLRSFLSGAQSPPTAEALMRSRYSAYTRAISTIWQNARARIARRLRSRLGAAWAAQAAWLGLEIQSTQAGGPADREGVVAFVATYRQSGETIAHREVSQFQRTRMAHGNSCAAM